MTDLRSYSITDFPVLLFLCESACESAVTLLFDAVMHLGCKPYLDSQRAACICRYEEKTDLWSALFRSKNPDAIEESMKSQDCPGSVWSLTFAWF